MKNKFLIIIIIIYTILLAIMLVFNGKNSQEFNSINQYNEKLIDSLKIEITTIEKRIPVREKIFDSIQLVLNRMDKNLLQMERLKGKIKLDLSDAIKLLPSNVDSLKIIALEK